jgi:hypothetical protein
MKFTLLFFLLSFTSISFSQLLGIYDFTGTGSCPNQSPNVTTQPSNSEFDPFSMQNVFCVSTQNVFNTKSWNTGVDLNPSEFIQFGLHTISCDRFTLDSLIFEYRNTAAGNTPTWHLRSSIDDFASDIASGVSSTVPGMLSDTILFNSANFSLLADVKFRIYLTEMGSTGAAFRIDNVQLFGSETFVGTLDYYADNDGDGYGTGIALPACVNPGGYSLNNLDCDDNNASINPGTFWYQDNDGDGFGNDSEFETGCTSTFSNPVANSEDCDDANINLNPNTIWYQDLDDDGFGDDANTEQGCDPADLTITNPVLVGGDCSDIASDLNPNTIWYSDNDGDGFGNPDIFEVACISSFFVPVMNGDDCDDSREFNYPGAIEICDEFDNNCDGQNNEGFNTTVYYIDNDGDGYGAGSAGDFCSDPGLGYVLNNDDCNDDDNMINPTITEIPNNGIDEDCDGEDATNSIADSKKLELKIYPNPGTENFFISSTSLALGENYLRITDINGKFVFESKLNIAGSYFMEIPSTNFTKGVYQIEIKNASQIVRANWVKL